MDRWTGKVVLVTETSSEIGRSIVEELSKYPLKIVAVAQRIDLIQRLADELKSSAAKIYPVQCDLTSECNILKLFEWIETTISQGVSVLINNASVSITSKILNGETNDWKNMYDINVLASTIYCRESYKSMKKYGIDDGQVININSTAGHSMQPFPGQKLYNSTETALLYLTEGYRHELAVAGSKIKVTSISPGNVRGDRNVEKNVNQKLTLSMMPERVASMVIVVLATPPDIVIAELTVLSVGETVQAYPPPMF